jgi:selenide,water dikinase
LQEFALWAKPVEAFLEGWARVLELARGGGLSKMTVVGGGAGGVELMLAMHHRLRSELAPEAFARCGFSIVTDTPGLLPGQPAAAVHAVERLCAARAISLVRGSRAIAVERDCVVLENGARLASDITVWVTGARPARWLAQSGLACDADGFMLIEDTLQSANCATVFGAGDCASSAMHPRPKAGVYAVRQGPVLAHNLRRALAGADLAPYVPQAHALALLSLGTREALALRGPFALTRPRGLLWRWKDAIDRRWIRRYI